MNGLFTSLTDADIKRIGIVLLLIFFNFLFAVLGALMKGGFNVERGGFDVKKLPEFVYKDILPYILGLAFFEAFLHILPPSDMTGALFPGATPLPAGDGLVPLAVEEPESWKWLDVGVLWTMYGSIVLRLVQKTFTNLTYLFGKGLVLAQGVANKNA